MTRGEASLFILVDALGHELLRDRPFLDDILTTRHRVDTILGYSSGAIPSLLTGSFPSAHGHWNLFYRSPASSPFRWTRPLLALPEAVREHRVTRKLVKEVSRRLSGYDGYFTIYNLPLDRIRHFDICETTDIYKPGGLAPAASIFDLMQQAGIGYECFNYHRHSDEAILRSLPDRLGIADHRVFFVYLSGLDSFLHFNVHDSRAVDAKIRWYEAGIRKLYEAASRRWERVRLRVFSDHGMTPLRDSRDLISEVRRLRLRVPIDFLPVYDSTMARFWFASDAVARQLRDLLGGLRCGRVLEGGELAELGLSFPDDRYGQLIFVMEPGLLICPSDMGRVPFRGMHGFHPSEDPHAAAAYLANDPAGRPIRHITEVLPELLDDLGIREQQPRPAALGA
jgi:hypothetical protein